MNSIREALAALDCHILFFLMPSSYRKFLQLADHLADWTPLKLHIMDDGDRHERKDIRSQSIKLESDGSVTSSLARQTLAVLEKQLVRELQSGIGTSSLIRRFYLPMFQAAVSINDLKRANNLRLKIIEADVSEPDLHKWYQQNFLLDLESYRLSEAENWAWKLKSWAEKKITISGKRKPITSWG